MNATASNHLFELRMSLDVTNSHFENSYVGEENPLASRLSQDFRALD